MTTPTPYRTPAPRASGGPEPLADLLAPIVAELEERLRRRPGVRWLVEHALRLRAAGVPHFRDVSAIDLVAELVRLGRDDADAVLADVYGAPAEEVAP